MRKKEWYRRYLSTITIPNSLTDKMFRCLKLTTNIYRDSKSLDTSNVVWSVVLRNVSYIWSWHILMSVNSHVGDAWIATNTYPDNAHGLSPFAIHAIPLISNCDLDLSLPIFFIDSWDLNNVTNVNSTLI